MKVQRKTKPNKTVLNAEHPLRTTNSIHLIHKRTKRIQRLKTKMTRRKKKVASITTMLIRFRS